MRDERSQVCRGRASLFSPLSFSTCCMPGMSKTSLSSSHQHAHHLPAALPACPLPPACLSSAFPAPSTSTGTGRGNKQNPATVYSCLSPIWVRHALQVCSSPKVEFHLSPCLTELCGGVESPCSGNNCPIPTVSTGITKVLFLSLE